MIDGDTIECEVKATVVIRLLDVWAPESRTKDLVEKEKGLAAKRHLQLLTEGAEGVVFIPTEQAKSVTDLLTMGRVLGHFWIDGRSKSLSQLQVEAGFAATEKGLPLGT